MRKYKIFLHSSFILEKPLGQKLCLPHLLIDAIFDNDVIRPVDFCDRIFIIVAVNRNDAAFFFNNSV